MVNSLIYMAHYASPLGDITLACDSEAITGLWFEGQKHFAAPPHAPWKDMGHLRPEASGIKPLDDARRWLNDYFGGLQPGAPPPLHPGGSPFCLSVYGILRTIPYGQTTTYGQIARRLNVPSARAVGQAVGRNPIALMIPCHRVIGQGGKLTGFAAGLERKEWLLRLERYLV